MYQLPAEGISLGGVGLLKWTAHHVPLSLFVMIGVGLRVGRGAFANCNVGRKPQAADTSIIPHVGPK